MLEWAIVIDSCLTCASSLHCSVSDQCPCDVLMSTLAAEGHKAMEGRAERLIEANHAIGERESG
jgi:hypothetical protein